MSMYVTKNKPELIRITFRGKGVNESFLVDKSTFEEINGKLEAAMQDTPVTVAEPTTAKRKYTRRTKTATWPQEVA